MKSPSTSPREEFVEDMARALLATLHPEEFSLSDEDEEEFSLIQSSKL